MAAAASGPPGEIALLLQSPSPPPPPIYHQPTKQPAKPPSPWPWASPQNSHVNPRCVGTGAGETCSQRMARAASMSFAGAPDTHRGGQPSPSPYYSSHAITQFTQPFFVCRASFDTRRSRERRPPERVPPAFCGPSDESKGLDRTGSGWGMMMRPGCCCVTESTEPAGMASLSRCPQHTAKILHLGWLLGFAKRCLLGSIIPNGPLFLF